MTRLKRAADILAGAAAGLYLARVWIDGQMALAPASRTLLIALAAAAVGIGLALALTRFRIRIWPLLFLLAYAIWPLVSPDIALWIGSASLVLLLVVNLPPPASFAIEIPVGVAALALYVWTLSPGVLPADSGEFQFVSHVLGIAHPPGYPLYTLLGKLATLLPVESVAWRVNLLSAVFASLTLALVARAVRRETQSPTAGLASALALGGITTFWAQATTANIRSLMALFTVSLLLLALEYGRSPSRRTLVLLGAVAGLAVGHHGSLAFLFVPLAVYLLFVDRKLPKRVPWLLQGAGAFAASLLVLLYLPIRSMTGAPFDTSHINSVSRFLEHVLAQGFRGDMFYFAQAHFLPGRIGVWLNIMRMEFGAALSIAIALAALVVLVRRPKAFLLIGGVFFLNTATAITYRAPQTVEYLMPSYVALVLLLGVGLGEAVSALGRRSALRALLTVGVLALSVGPWWDNLSSFRWLSRDMTVEQTARSLLSAAPEDATILASWHWSTPLWYLQYVEHARPDVEVVYVHPEGATPNGEVWAHKIGESLQEGPVLVTNWFYEYEKAGFRFVRQRGGWRVLDQPLPEAPSQAQALDATFDGRIRVLGYEVGGTELSPGSELSVRLYWQPTAPLEGNHSFFVHLVNAAGEVLGQSDVTHRGSGLQVGEVIADDHQISVLPTAVPGDYRILIGAYVPQGDGWQRLQTADGADSLSIAGVRVRAATEAAVTLHPMHQPFAGGLTLLGADCDVAGSGLLYLHWRNRALPPGDYAVEFLREDSLVVQSGIRVPQAPAFFTSSHHVPYAEGWTAIRLRDISGAQVMPVGPWGRVWENRTLLPQFGPSERYVNLGGEMLFTGFDVAPPAETGAGQGLRASPAFVALKPIVRDYSVSLMALGEGGVWSAQHDSTPALGAIPTLKWTRGVNIDDPHEVEIPAAAAAGSQAALQLTVYDAFTLDPLPVLDAELARLGQGQHLVVGQVVVR